MTKQELFDTLFETIVEMLTNQEAETVANVFYAENSKMINKELFVETKADFISYLERVECMNMKNAEYHFDKIINVIFEIGRSFQEKKIEKIIVDYYDSEFSYS